MRILKEAKASGSQEDRSEGHIVLGWESVEVTFEERLETRRLKTESGRTGKGFHRGCCREHSTFKLRESLGKGDPPSLLHGFQS